MRRKIIVVQRIIEYLGSSLIPIYGDIDGYIDNLANPSNVNSTTLDWVNPAKANKQAIAECSPAKVLLVDGTVNYTDVIAKQKKTLLVAYNPKLELAKIGNVFL